jgi:hypothetical protein
MRRAGLREPPAVIPEELRDLVRVFDLDRFSRSFGSRWKTIVRTTHFSIVSRTSRADVSVLARDLSKPAQRFDLFRALALKTAEHVHDRM